ncbi:MAG TPA: hypothetical protein DEQ98_13875, partial [Acidobacteria bacterium]|nr:hypothetical protein [Acidobacteriota bacterium]
MFTPILGWRSGLMMGPSERRWTRTDCAADSAATHTMAQAHAAASTLVNRCEWITSESPPEHSNGQNTPSETVNQDVSGV